MLTAEENRLIVQTGPGTPMGTLFRRFWLPALLSSELPGPDCAPVRVRLLGEDLIAFRDSTGEAGLLGDHCPHRGASLFFGRNEEAGLRCVYHGWKFDREGRCVDMPNEPPESNFKHKIQHTAYPCRKRAGLVWAYLGPKDLRPELPDLEWTLVPESHRYITKVWADCNYLQAMEGDYDNSHAGFLHGRLAGPPELRVLDRLMAARRPMGSASATSGGVRVTDNAPRGMVTFTDYGIMMGWRRNANESRYLWRINHWLLPSHSLIPGGASGDLSRGILAHVQVPVDDDTSWTYQVRYRPDQPLPEELLNEDREGSNQFTEVAPGSFRAKANKSNDYRIDRSLQRTVSFTGVPSIPQQDRMVTESMGAVTDRTKEHLGTSDVVIIQTRRRLLELMHAVESGGELYAPYHPEVYRIRPADVLLGREEAWTEATEDLVNVPG